MPCIDHRHTEAATTHQDRIERLMAAKQCSQDAAERIAWEADQVARLCEKLNNEQQYEVHNQNSTRLMVQVGGLTDAQIDEEAKKLARRLREERR